MISVQEDPTLRGEVDSNNGRLAAAMVCRDQLKDDSKMQMLPSASPKSVISEEGAKPPILLLGRELMASVLAFLEPQEILHLLIMPLSKDWQTTFTDEGKLWAILCSAVPFKAPIASGNEDVECNNDDNCSMSYFSASPISQCSEARGMYVSFVQCIRHLERIKNHSVKTRQQYTTASHDSHRNINGIPKVISCGNNHQDQNVIGLSDEDMEYEIELDTSTSRKYLVPRISTDVDSTPAELPRSGAIYSIINWMVSFPDVEGIQIMCLKALPVLLENEAHRRIAREAGLADVVVLGMAVFSQSVELHAASFHTIVLLARPLGGKEGLLFRSSVGLRRNCPRSSEIIINNVKNENNAVSVMLDSMRRFMDNEMLESMACWSIVNVALAPKQRDYLIRLGAMNCIADAMARHPRCLEVQLKALLALINLFKPRCEHCIESSEAVKTQDVSRIVHLVSISMNRFCWSEDVLGRACSVLFNISLTKEHRVLMIWTPLCCQMLQWCTGNYGNDLIWQRQASKILRRLQETILKDDNLRTAIDAQIVVQARQSLLEVRLEASRLEDRHQQLLLERRKAKKEKYPFMLPGSVH